jgi:small subunit ribosomal protein S19
MTTRPIWKGPFIEPNLLKKVNNLIAKKSHYAKRIWVKTWSRKSTILPHFVGMQFAIHNGRYFEPIFISERMVGKRFGEFSLTRKFLRHGKNK